MKLNPVDSLVGLKTRDCRIRYRDALWHTLQGPWSHQSHMYPLNNSPIFRSITPGIESLRSCFSLPRHRHLHAYATVVLAGSFDEAGYIGRIRATAGDVLIHPTLDCHANRMVSAGVKLIRLNWPDSSGSGGLYRIDEIDDVARTAENDVTEAALILEHALNLPCSTPSGKRDDWPDALAAALTENTDMEIGDWAEANCLARETVSRGFATTYGITPAGFRAEWRARKAWLRLTGRSDPLCRIAAEIGFSDQAHMTRWIHRITGAPPAAWRRQLNLKTFSGSQIRSRLRAV